MTDEILYSTERRICKKLIEEEFVKDFFKQYQDLLLKNFQAIKDSFASMRDKDGRPLRLKDRQFLALTALYFAPVDLGLEDKISNMQYMEAVKEKKIYSSLADLFVSFPKYGALKFYPKVLFLLIGHMVEMRRKTTKKGKSKK